jgi:hypothetical protein
MATYPEVPCPGPLSRIQAVAGQPRRKAGTRSEGSARLLFRIERAAARLPHTVIAAGPDISMVERRLYLSIGEPGLSHESQVWRMQVIAGAREAYVAIGCVSL